ncbi:MAG TPA: hypothetical protein VMR37_08035 [Rhabdochlamydiaceae bacterium]|nr:hypothetical protein [Rhabdochlamydiaceae bacterium]
MTVDVVRAAEQSKPFLQMSEMDEAGNVALPAITEANQHLMIKGTAGRYGIFDSLVFAFYSVTSRFMVLNPATAKQLAFYQHFNALKSALKTSDRPKIKQSYDNLVRTVRSHTSNFEEKRLDEVLLTILNEELSEPATNALLHEIRLMEGSKMAHSLGRFINMPTTAIEDAVFSNYGTPDQVLDDFCHAAAHTECDAVIGQFIAQKETAVSRFEATNFADHEETKRMLNRLCEYLGNHMIGSKPITPGLLEQIQENGIFLVRGLRNLEQLAARLEQIRLEHAGPRQERSRKIDLYQKVLQLGPELEKLEGIILDKRAALSVECIHQSSDVRAFVGEGIDQGALQEELRRDRAQYDQLIVEVEDSRKLLNQALALEHLSKALPATRKILEIKQGEIERLKQKYHALNLSLQMQELLRLYIDEQALNAEKLRKDVPRTCLESIQIMGALVCAQVEYQNLYKSIQGQVPLFHVKKDLQEFIRLDREIGELDRSVAVGRSINAQDRALIAGIPELKASIVERGNQLRELAVRMATGQLLRQMSNSEECDVAGRVLLALRPAATVTENNPVARDYSLVRIQDAQLKLAEKTFQETRQAYEAAYAEYVNRQLPKVEEKVQPLQVTAAGLAADPSIQEFSAEIVQTVSQQTAQMVKAQFKDRYLQSLDIARRICEVKAVEEAQAFQETVNRMNPLLRQAFSHQIERARPNSHQVQKEYCNHLRARLTGN